MKEKKYYVAVETMLGVYLFGADNMFYNVSEFIDDDVELYEFTEDDGKMTIEKLFHENFDFYSLQLDVKVGLVGVDDIEWVSDESEVG